MKKSIFVSVFLFGIVVFFNAGRWLDVTEKPIKSDIVVCLGGGTIERVKKSIEMIEEGYVDKMLLLGESWYNQPYIKEHYTTLPMEIDESSKNTEEEVLFIKQYMKKYNYKSALIVTDPPHSARVKVLLWLYTDKNLEYHIVGSDVSWWSVNSYYKNKKAYSFVWHEMVKIPIILLLKLITPDKMKRF